MNEVTEIYCRGRTSAEHSAWLASLTGDEYRIVHMPIGHLFNIAFASFAKEALLKIEMTAGERLKILDTLAGMISGPLTAEAIAAIEPADTVGLQMLREIMRLPVERQVQAFDAGDVFRLMARLNPSLLRALRLCVYHSTVPE
ncbi:hypothetical protein QCM80_22960 [Bradyrhizobium sp. SSUT112]|uniref:hypothetical protein n=1 Tax=Bradyrhizobium sp. SSUT112 TaxID=3040604 RepID=UPI00244BD4BE|nr:hypothetical protein [Bradyrhizobium sp. SSUT112]MDH2353498.1 hypothetical protein [Bradyrhizobium sp. SSUT112]